MVTYNRVMELYSMPLALTAGVVRVGLCRRRSRGKAVQVDIGLTLG